MTEQISFPPLHDLAPGELERRKQHLLSEITDQARSSRAWWPRDVPLRLRFALPAAAAICAAVAAVVFVSMPGAPGGVSNRSTTGAHQKNTAPTLSQLRRAGGPAMLPGGVAPVKHIEVADLSATLGAPVILPSTSLVQPSDATHAMEQGCPYTQGEPNITGCLVSVSFPAQSLFVSYNRPLMPNTPGWYSAYARHLSTATVTNLNGVAALEIIPHEIIPAGADPETPPSKYPGWIEFAVGGTRVIVAGYQDRATLEDVAKSIIAQASPGS